MWGEFQYRVDGGGAVGVLALGSVVGGGLRFVVSGFPRGEQYIFCFQFEFRRHHSIQLASSNPL